MNPKKFQTQLSSDFYFPTCKNIYNKHEQQLDEKATSSFLNITCQRNLTSLYGKQIVICVILERKKSRNMCQKVFFSCLQGIRMRRSKREEQKTNV